MDWNSVLDVGASLLESGFDLHSTGNYPGFTSETEVGQKQVHSDALDTFVNGLLSDFVDLRIQVGIIRRATENQKANIWVNFRTAFRSVLLQFSDDLTTGSNQKCLDPFLVRAAITIQVKFTGQVVLGSLAGCPGRGKDKVIRQNGVGFVLGCDDGFGRVGADNSLNLDFALFGGFDSGFDSGQKTSLENVCNMSAFCVRERPHTICSSN